MTSSPWAEAQQRPRAQAGHAAQRPAPPTGPALCQAPGTVSSASWKGTAARGCPSQGLQLLTAAARTCACCKAFWLNPRGYRCYNWGPAALASSICWAGAPRQCARQGLIGALTMVLEYISRWRHEITRSSAPLQFSGWTAACCGPSSWHKRAEHHSQLGHVGELNAFTTQSDPSAEK